MATTNNKRRAVPTLGKNTGIPNGRLLMESIGLTQDRLDASMKTKVGVPTRVLRELIKIMASTLPFDREFYLATYQDVREAYEDGRIEDPKTHFIEQGYFEGRLGAKPDIDEQFYRSTYPDVQAAIEAGELRSALEHYLRAGVFEARFPNSESVADTKHWLAILGRQ